MVPRGERWVHGRSDVTLSDAAARQCLKSGHPKADGMRGRPLLAKPPSCAILESEPVMSHTTAERSRWLAASLKRLARNNSAILRVADADGSCPRADQSDWPR
jgi:hypothetical protein